MFSKTILIVLILPISLLAMIFSRKLAVFLKLMDKPDSRKKHTGHIPLSGGIGLYICLVFLLGNAPYILPSAKLYLYCVSILFLVGLLDDKFNLHFSIKIITQILISLIMIYGGGFSLLSLGNIIPNYSLVLQDFSVLLTVISVIAAINAFNMIDGIDGLLGSVGIIYFSFIFIVTFQTEQNMLAYFSIAIILVLTSFLFLNIGLFFSEKKKIFMGDSGSMIIGFTAVWLLIHSTQSEPSPLRPVAALWLIALPLMDMATVMLRRSRSNSSIFKPDREHLHHVFLKYGYSHRATLIIITIISFLLSLIGMSFEFFKIPEWFSFISFLMTFTFYTILIDTLSESNI